MPGRSYMHLVLFDIDGTLTESQAIDSDLYMRSLVEACGFEGVSPDWATYRHTTDSGILRELFESQRGRVPTDQEVASFRHHFVEAVARAAARTPFREIEGAGRLLEHLGRIPSYWLGLATGGWSDSARCKMRSAGMNYDAFPAASADDGVSREEIMQAAVTRVIERARGRHPRSIVYVGDAIWDARACKRLGVPFVGIGVGTHAQMLRTEGAAAVFADYSDLDAVCAALARASRATPSATLFEAIR